MVVPCRIRLCENRVSDDANVVVSTINSSCSAFFNKNGMRRRSVKCVAVRFRPIYSPAEILQESSVRCKHGKKGVGKALRYFRISFLSSHHRTERDLKQRCVLSQPPPSSSSPCGRNNKQVQRICAWCLHCILYTALTQPRCLTTFN